MYNTEKILETQYIGDTLPIINSNFETLENWTNNILLSSQKYYQPLVNFYREYGEFWKSSINFSKKINAIERLSNFSTNVETNSAKYVKPIVIIYPNVLFFNINNIENYKTDAIKWFIEKYPVKNVNNLTTYFVENSVAFIYLIFYTEKLKINSIDPIEIRTLCQTNDVSISVNCKHTLSGDVSCGRRKIVEDNVCQRNKNVSCSKSYPVTCSYGLNNEKSMSRGGKLLIDQYFNDRAEIDNMNIYMLKVENCEWVYKSTIPYNNVL